MEKEPDDTNEVEAPPPPPFDPDPDLITYLERGKKPTREELKALTERPAS